MDDDSKVIESNSICFLCAHSMLMAVEVERPKLNRLTNPPRVEPVAAEVPQAVCHRWMAPLLFSERAAVRACTEWEPREAKPLRAPGVREAIRSVQ